MFPKKRTSYCTCHAKAATQILNNIKKLKKIDEEHKILRKPRWRNYYKREILSGV